MKTLNVTLTLNFLTLILSLGSDLSQARADKAPKAEKSTALTPSPAEETAPMTAENQVAQELLIRFVSEAAFEARSSLLEKYQLTELDVVRTGKLIKVLVPADQTVQEMIKTLKNEPSVKYAEPNFKVSIMK